jgi:nucleotide-binding universal stress UspA family protein
VDEPDIRAGAATGIGGASFKQQRDKALLTDALAHADQWLARFTERCRAAGVEGRAVEERGRPSQVILEHMPRHDLTVIGRDANFRFETDADDAHTRDALLHAAERPMLFVPATTPAVTRKTLIAFDGSSAARRAIAAFVDSGLARGKELHVASVDDDGARAWEMASRGVALLAHAGLTSSPHNVVSTLSIAGALVDLQRKLEADWMVMGAYARSRLADLIWGSVTRELIEQTRVPLFLQR